MQRANRNRKEGQSRHGAPVDDESTPTAVSVRLVSSWTSCRSSSHSLRRCGLTVAAVRRALPASCRSSAQGSVHGCSVVEQHRWKAGTSSWLEARAAWLSVGRRGWASHYTAAVLNGLPVPRDQPAMVTISQASAQKVVGSTGPVCVFAPHSRLARHRFGMGNGGPTPARTLSMWPACTVSSRPGAGGFGVGARLGDCGRPRSNCDVNGRLEQHPRRLVADHASGRRSRPPSRGLSQCSSAWTATPECNNGWSDTAAGRRSGLLLATSSACRRSRWSGEVHQSVRAAGTCTRRGEGPAAQTGRSGLVVVRWSGAEIQRNPDRVIDRIVRQSRIASELYGRPLLRPDGLAWHDWPAVSGTAGRSARTSRPSCHCRVLARSTVAIGSLGRCSSARFGTVCGAVERANRRKGV